MRWRKAHDYIGKCLIHYEEVCDRLHCFVAAYDVDHEAIATYADEKYQRVEDYHEYDHREFRMFNVIGV